MYSWQRREKIAKQIKEKLGSGSYYEFHYAIDYCLHEMMRDDETIEKAAIDHTKYSKQLLLATSSQLMRIAAHTTDKGQIFCLPYEQIRSIEYEDKLLSGKSGKISIVTERNKTEVFENLDKKQGRGLAEFIKGVVAKHVAEESPEVTILLLEKLSKMKFQGLITEEEFQMQKSKLLGEKETLGVVTSQHGDAIYGDNECYKSYLYYGRVSQGARLLLMDRRVYKDEYGLDIIKVKVLSNDWQDEIGKIGWVGLNDTSFKDDLKM